MRQGAVFHSSLSTECVTVQHWYICWTNATTVTVMQSLKQTFTRLSVCRVCEDSTRLITQYHSNQDNLIHLKQTNLIITNAKAISHNSRPSPTTHTNKLYNTKACLAQNFQKRPVCRLRCIVCKNKTHSGLLLTRSSEHNPCPNGLWHFFIVNLGVSKSMKVNISTWRLPK